MATDLNQEPSNHASLHHPPGLHQWQAPFERIAALAAAQGVSVTTPRMGEAVNLEQPQAGQPWWRGVK